MFFGALGIFSDIIWRATPPQKLWETLFQMQTVAYSRAETPADFAEVRKLALQYAEWDVVETAKHGIPAEVLLSFQHDYRVDSLFDKYAAADGVMYLARVDDVGVGCGALDLTVANVAEIKTFYVDPAFRGRSIGKNLLEILLAEAASRGCRTVRLETVNFMENAVRLYRAYGFADCPPYYPIPELLLPITLFMKLDLV